MTIADNLTTNLQKTIVVQHDNMVSLVLICNSEYDAMMLHDKIVHALDHDGLELTLPPWKKLDNVQ